MSYQKTLVALVAALVLGASSTALASVDTSAKPGGVFKLKPGIYVAEGASCEAPAETDIRRYDGKGISTTETRACKATVRSRKQQTFTVNQSCLDSAGHPGASTVQRQQVTVHDALTFTQSIGRDKVRYRYCPVNQVPERLRKAADIQ